MTAAVLLRSVVMGRRSTVVALASLALSGCGGGESAQTAPEPRGPASDELRAALERATLSRSEDFPAASGRTLREIADSLDGTGTQVAFATQTLVTGHQRLAFGIIDAGNRFVYAPSAVYVADGPNRPARGPYPAPADLLVTDPAFRSQQAATEEDPFAAIYETIVDFPKAGRQAILVASRVNETQTVGAGATVIVRRPSRDRVVSVGEPAPRVETDTRVSAGGDLEAIDTRRPNDTMHEDDLADVLGERPVALLFATPQLCQSRVCGPVVDIAEQLKSTYGDRMAFIHQEVYVDNDPNEGLREPLRRFGLRTEPWLFVIGADGRVVARLEGSFGFDAFEKAVRAGLAAS